MSYEFKGTPAPWKWGGDATNYDKYNKAHWLVGGVNETVILSGEIDCTNKANASLIAAAPNLFEELININKVLDEMWNDTNRESKKDYYEKKICEAQARSLKAIHKVLNIKP